MSKQLSTTIVFIAILFLISGNIFGQQVQKFVEGKPFMHIQRNTNQNLQAPTKNAKYRKHDGTNNNVSLAAKNHWGSTDIKLVRELTADYGPSDKLNAIGGTTRPSPRAISNTVCDEPVTIFSTRDLSAMVYVWGQFLDHDINLTPSGSTEYAPIALPVDETLFTLPIPFYRSEVMDGTGRAVYPREQVNLVTAWIDASNVYGSDETRSVWIRTLNKGKMKTSAGNLLPYNTMTGEYDAIIDVNAPSMANDKNKTVKTFVAGDVRAAEHPALTSLHTLFVREHNKIADRLYQEGMRSDEDIYQMARKEVGAIIQAITYNEFLPALGIKLNPYGRYNPNVSPDIYNSFATGSYRLGHTMVADDILMVDNDCKEWGPGELDLLEVFWNPSLVKEYNIEYFVKGALTHTQYETDLKVNGVLRNFLFGDPTAPVRFGLDLASVNIQRGRDHGLANYNAYRKLYTGKAATKFSDITTNTELAAKLQTLYGNVNNIDLWVGLLAEDALTGKSVGKTMHEMLRVQFEKLRDGDFYYFQNDPYIQNRVRDNISRSKFSDVIKRNTPFTNIQANVFFTEHCPDGNTIVTNNRSSQVATLDDATLYPNPASTEVNIDLGFECSTCTLSLNSIDGKIVKNLVTNQNQQFITIDVADVYNGMYFINVKNGTQSKVLKFVKQ